MPKRPPWSGLPPRVSVRRRLSADKNVLEVYLLKDMLIRDGTIIYSTFVGIFLGMMVVPVYTYNRPLRTCAWQCCRC
jgi:hypothetical protein